MKKAIAYIRKSTDTKDKQKFSIETQLREVEVARQKAEIHFGENIELEEIFIEKISGSSGTKRPEFEKVCKMFANKEADILLSWKLDRLSRNHADSFMLIQALENGTIPCIQDSNRLWTKRDTGLQMYVTLGLANEEAKQISERVKLGLETMIKKGGIPFRPPF